VGVGVSPLVIRLIIVSGTLLPYPKQHLWVISSSCFLLVIGPAFSHVAHLDSVRREWRIGTKECRRLPGK